MSQLKYRIIVVISIIILVTNFAVVVFLFKTNSEILTSHEFEQGFITGILSTYLAEGIAAFIVDILKLKKGVTE